MTDPEQTSVNIRIAEAFDRLSILYFLGGSMASSLHGMYRATADADFIATIRPEHAGPLARFLEAEFYVDEEAIRTAATKGRSFNLIHLGTMLKVDVFVAAQDPFRLEQMRRRKLQPVSLDGQVSMYVASAEDTVLAKLKWYQDGGGVSDRQWGDVQGVLKIQGRNLDQDYLRQWARILNIENLLQRSLDDAGISPAT